MRRFLKRHIRLEFRPKARISRPRPCSRPRFAAPWRPCCSTFTLAKCRRTNELLAWRTTRLRLTAGLRRDARIFGSRSLLPEQRRNPWRPPSSSLHRNARGPCLPYGRDSRRSDKSNGRLARARTPVCSAPFREPARGFAGVDRGLWEHRVHLAGGRKHVLLPVQFDGLPFDNRISLPQPGVSGIDRPACRAIGVKAISRNSGRSRRKIDKLAAPARIFNRGHSPEGMKFTAGLIEGCAASRRF